MFKNLLVFFMVGQMSLTYIPKKVSVVVEKIDNKVVTTEIYINNGNREDIYQFDIYESDFNFKVFEGEKLTPDISIGTFTGKYTSWDGTKYSTYYEFRSYDNTSWWDLEEKDIGFIPIEGKRYTLVSYNNGTTKENHDCPEEYDCECYLYDDVFLGVY